MKVLQFPLLASLLLVGYPTLHAADWKPADSPIMTPWAAKVDPAKPWPEYPRPQLVRPEWTNLNGLWNYAITPKSADKAPTSWDGKILVPFCIESALSGVKKRVSDEQYLWYKTEFTAPKVAAGEKVMLNFGGVDWQAVVYVNGKEVGQHEGVHSPFSFDITSALKGDGPQELVVRVWDPTDKGPQPRGKQINNPHGIWYTPVTGIWQTVWLETVPANAISAIKVVPDIDSKTATFTVKTPEAAPVKISVLDGGKEVATASGNSNQPLVVSLPTQKLWSPDSPFLYDVKITAGDDSVSSYFGQRKISMMKDEKGINRMALNNEILFQYGPLDQGWWPDGLYTAPTDEALKWDIEMTKKYGFNATRKHIKVEPSRWYYWTDKLGLMVWQDQSTFMQSGRRDQVQPGDKEDVDATPEAATIYKKELEMMLNDLQAHPSIVVWVPFNEGWGQHNTNEILDWVKKYDPTRLVDGPSGWEDRGEGDMHDMHNYPGPGMFPVSSDRISVLGEFGGLGYPVKGHLWQGDRNWGYQNMGSEDELMSRYTVLMNKLSRLVPQGLAAGIYTQITDVEGEVNGLITYDRKVLKLDVDKIAAIHKGIIDGTYVVTEKPVVPTSRETAQQWKYTTDKPADNWADADFDDSSWKTGPAGFGTAGTPNAVVGTEWKTGDIWIRRTADVDPASLKNPALSIIHDNAAEVYINGVKAFGMGGHIGDYEAFPLTDAAKKALKKGKNVIAAHAHQDDGGQIIDVGIVDLSTKK